MTEIFGRITGKTSNGSVPVTQTFTYNMRNLLETATDTVANAAATSVTRLYDSFGNPYSESVTANNVTKTVSRRMTDAKTYQFTYPDGKTLRKTATGNDLDSIEYNNSEIASYSRANGVLTAVTKGQNLIETFSYNNWNMLDNHTVNNTNTNADVYDMSYNYSRGWHLVEKADGIRNTSDKYSYDSYYRLKEVKYDFANNTAARTDSFFQDGVHNIEQSTENGVTYAWGVDKLNRLRNKKIGGNTAVTYKYDERNNMIGEDFDGSEPTDINYIYDDLNRLIEVKDGSNQTIATYTYDAFNRRITKTVGSTTERYSYDDWDIVEISTNSNDYTNIIDSGTDRHIAVEVTANNTSTLYYFLTDERGNVTALTDESGNILERYRYRVYGDFEILDSQFAPKDCSNQTCYATNLHNFLWGGSLYEPETGLYWMRNRYYHIDMHRFINQDPIGIWGDANNLGNGFAYVAGMVVEASDPTGLEIKPIYFTDGKYFLPNFVEDAWAKQGHEPSAELLEQSKDLATQSFVIRTPTGEMKYADIIELISNLMVFVNTFCDELEKTLVEANHRKYGFKDDDIIYQKTFKDNDGKFLGEATIYADRSFTFSYKDKNGNGFEVDFNSRGIRIEKREYKNKRLVKRWKWQVVGKDESGNDIYDWVEVPVDLMPSDPYSDNDAQQNFVRNQFLKKILEVHEKKSSLEMMNEVGPVIKYDDNGRKVFIFNPFYRGKDPMKEIFWGTKKPMVQKVLLEIPSPQVLNMDMIQRLTKSGNSLVLFSRMWTLIQICNKVVLYKQILIHILIRE